MSFRAAIASLSMLILSCTYAEQQRPTPAGEVIIKFSADQPVNSTILKAFDDKSAESALVESIRGLSSEEDIPIEYSRLTSGREVIVEVPEDRIFDALLRRLNNSGDVDEVVVNRRGDGGGSRELLVAIRPDKTAPRLEEDADALARHLLGDNETPVSCEFRVDGRLAIEPDFERLLEQIAATLAARDDVEYAQPNFRARHYR